MRTMAMVLLRTALVVAVCSGSLHAQVFNRNFPDADAGTSSLGDAGATALYMSGLFMHMEHRDGVGVIISDAGSQTSSRQYANFVIGSIPDGSGGFYVSGQFDWVDDSLRSRIVRLTSSGAIDPNFNPPVINSVVRTMMLAGGFLYIGGDFTSIGGSTFNRLARLNPATGAVDNSFSVSVTGNSTARINALESNSNGSMIYIGGNFTTVGGLTRNNIAKIKTVGTIGTDATYNTGTDGWVRAIQLTGNRLYIGGDFQNVGASARSFIAKVDSSAGAPVSTWHPAANDLVYDVKLVSGGIMCAGNFTTIGGKNRNRMAKVNSDGTIATGFVISGTVNDRIASITPGPGTTWYAVGAFTFFDGTTRNHAAKVDASGNVQTWNPGSGGWTDMLTVAYDPNNATSGEFLGGRGDFELLSKHFARVNGSNAVGAEMDTTTILSGYAFRTVGGTQKALVVGPNAYIHQTSGQTFFGRNHFAEWDVASNMTSSQIRPTGTGVFRDIAMIDSNHAIVVGNFDTIQVFDGASWISGPERHNIAEIVFGGSTPVVDTVFNPDAGGNINKVIVNNGRIYIAGTFTSVGGNARNGLAAIDASSGAVLAWDPNPVPAGTVSSIAANASGLMVFVGGTFDSVGGAARARIGCLDTSGTAVTGWNPGANNTVNVVRVDDTVLYAGGDFTTIGGVARNRVAALNVGTGVVDTHWNPNCDNSVLDIAIHNGQVVIAGFFTSILSRARNGIASVTKAAAPPAGKTNVGTATARIASAAVLHAYPNPAHGSADIAFTTPTDGRVELRVFTADGRDAGIVYTGDAKAGERRIVPLRLEGMAPGVYFLRLTGTEVQGVERIIVTK
ncbi:MAG: T9SS type A sorting domain-containing protein [Bacteroidetes bacterium]|nr:T9SS type A sorting domain-containing protein [Bacteroidota bacterium]